MPIDQFARSVATSLVMSTYERRLTDFLVNIKAEQIEWLIKNNRNFTDFIPVDVQMQPGEKSRISGIARLVTPDSNVKMLAKARPDLAEVINNNNGWEWFHKQVELLKGRFLAG